MGHETPTVVVPAHITGFFTAHPAEKPLIAGSRGAGVTVADAVSVSVRPAEESSVVIDGEETSIPAVDYVLDQFDLPAEVTATLSVPIGAGFGVSGALALGTAFGANYLDDGRRSENELVGIAHAGEVTAESGLGDVVAQHRGGAPIRIEPGAPGYGELDAIADARQVEWISRGEIATETILTGDTSVINRAGSVALERIRKRPTLEVFMTESVRFAREADLLTDSLASIVNDVEAAGGQAAMAMLGRTVFALGDDLSAAGYEPNRAAMGEGGVRFVAPETDG